jgi:hypothetical protein
MICSQVSLWPCGYVVRLRNAVTPAKARSTFRAINADGGSVGIGATMIVRSLSALLRNGQHEPQETVAVFVTVPAMPRFTVNVIGEADTPGAMALDLVQSRMSVSPGQIWHDDLTTQDHALPVADTTRRSLGKISSTVICPLLAVPPLLDTTMV